MICSSLNRLPFIARLLFRRRTLSHLGGVFGVQASLIPLVKELRSNDRVIARLDARVKKLEARRAK